MSGPMQRQGDKGTLISPAGSSGSVAESGYGSSEHATRESSLRIGAFAEGEVLSDRFRIRELVQSGGMGDVYLADDLVAQRPVAVKTLRPGAASPERFEREALRLLELKHPGIPQYITHDLAGASLPYLVMEWLDGVDLGTHLRRGRVGLHTAVEIVKNATATIAAAHQQGVIHRDINPSNLFLVDADPSQVRVLDFGVSRLQEGDQPLTSEGTQIGTPGYMAPEQIEARGGVGPQADVFALGCVLYEAVTGTRAFYAPTIRELLTRMVTESPPLPRAHNPQIPEELEDLILRMLSKEPQNRPANASELLRNLEILPALPDTVIFEATSSPPSSAEQHIVSVIVLRGEEAGVYERAVRAAAPHGLRAHRGAEGTIVIATRGAGTAGDHATRAARCALAIQRATRASQIAVSTGLSFQTGEALSGRAMDSALVSLLLKDGHQSADWPQGPCLWLDENTASLLDSRFDVRAVERGYLLTGLRETYEPTRTVLGRKTRCVGRKRELSMLEATLREAFDEHSASAVLITGAPGIGKSRLAGEVTHVARRTIAGVQVVRGGAEPLSAGSPFAVLRDAIERACRMKETEPDAVRRQKLNARLAELLSGDDFLRVAEFLGELLGIAPEHEPSPQLEAARRDAVLRGDQILRALEDWLRAETRLHPVLLILDDFQWGDLPTVRWVDSILRNLSECPLMVLVLARPEIHEHFPKLWSKRGATEVRLSGLSRKATVEMIEEVLGPTVPKAALDRIILHGQGNPFWIEELLRAEHAGYGENVPDRVVLLAQSRIEQQSVDERRLLKAASVFGRQFWLSGAVAVMGPQSTSRSTENVLADLVENEFVVEHQVSRIGGQREYQFSSGLLRDAAYSLLVEDEKEEGHVRAADWLERNGDADPLAVAMHFSLGGQPERARAYYLRAAEQALAGDDLEAAVACAEEGLSAGALGVEAIRLRLVQAEAHKWRGDNAQAFRVAQAAFARAEEGTAEWFRAAAECAVAAGKTGKQESSIAIAKELLDSSPRRDALSEFGIALSRVATQLVLGGHKQLASDILARVGADEGRLEPDPQVMGFYNEARAVLAGASEDPVGRITYAERAVEHFEDAGDSRNACLGRLSQGFAEVEFGALDSAVVTLSRAHEVAERMGLTNSIPVARAQLGRALTYLGKLQEAEPHLEAAATTFDRQKNVRLAGMTRIYLAEHQLIAGQPEVALESALRAAEILEPLPPMRRVALALLAAVGSLLEETVAPSQVEAWAREALARLGPDDRLPVSETLVRMGASSGLFACGFVDEATQVLHEERARIAVQVASMSEERAMQYLEGSRARALLTCDSTLLSSEEARFRYAEFWMKPLATQQTGGATGTLDLTITESMTLEEVGRIVSETDPILRNLWITQSYHRLSTEIAGVIDKANVNWSTFACWASKTAGISIRNEEIPRFFRKELGLDQGELRGVGKMGERFIRLFGLGRFVQKAALDTLQEVSEQVSLGNRKVYAELAPLFARFVALMKKEPTEAEIGVFTESLQGGPIEQGGQELLKRAFRTWYDASRTESEGVRAQLILRANCQIGLHEQTRLQPHIQEAMDAPIATIWEKKLVGLLPRFIGAPVALLLKILARPFLRTITEKWERVATRHAMNLALPNGKEIPLGRDLPEKPHTFPPDLRAITDPKTEALLERFDRRLESTVGSGANNWADLNDRMGFIVELFRSRQQDTDLFSPPFTAEQTLALNTGKLPPGEL